MALAYGGVFCLVPLCFKHCCTHFQHTESIDSCRINRFLYEVMNVRLLLKTQKMITDSAVPHGHSELRLLLLTITFHQVWRLI